MVVYIYYIPVSRPCPPLRCIYWSGSSKMPDQWMQYDPCLHNISWSYFSFLCIYNVRTNWTTLIYTASHSSIYDSPSPDRIMWMFFPTSMSRAIPTGILSSKHLQAGSRTDWSALHGISIWFGFSFTLALHRPHWKLELPRFLCMPFGWAPINTATIAQIFLIELRVVTCKFPPDKQLDIFQLIAVCP